MIYAINGSQALQNMQVVTSRGTGQQHWSAPFFGPRDTSTTTDTNPHSLVTEMAPDETILPHFHGVPQFQIFSGGSGKMGRNELQPMVVQFKDRFTAYGPVVAGPHGLTFFAMRMQAMNSSPVYLGRPDAREKLKPSKRRNLFSQPLVLSTAPVLEYRKEVSWESLYPETYSDGLSAQILRLGAGMAATGPDPKAAGGHYLFVVNGSLDRAGENFPLWSMIAVEPNEAVMEIKAGEKGLEVLVLQFPIEAE
jgi:hypothetical protein